MIGPLRRFLRIAALVALVSVLAAACASEGLPESYDDQIDAETGLSNVALNWKEGCEPSLTGDLADSASSICECSFLRIRADIAFADFVEVNGRFAKNPEILSDLASSGNAVAAQIVDIVKSCIAEA